MVYTSLDNKLIKDIKKLQQKKYRDQTGLFIVEGEHLVTEAFKSGFLDKIVLEEGQSFPITKDNIYVSKRVMESLSMLDTHQSVIGICHKLKDKTLGSRILLLDNIQDPGNLGTIIRSAVAFNIDTIVLSNDTVDLYNHKVIRASQGLLFHINIVIADLVSEIHKLKDSGYTVIGSKVDGGKEINTFCSISKLALIMGNEGQGVKSHILDLCDDYCHIKMNAKCESLNVGVATSIMLYELCK